MTWNFTLDDFYLALVSINEARYAIIAMYALVTYELLSCMEDEIRLIHCARWTKIKGAYLACRYYPLILWPFVMWSYVGDHTREVCLVVGRPMHAFLAPCLFFPQAVMAMRAWAFSGRNTYIMCLLLVCWTALVGVDIWVFCTHLYMPPAELYLVLFRTGCFPNYGEGITAMRIGYSMLAAVLMDLISLIVVLAFCHIKRSREVSLGRYFVKQGLVSFAFVTVLNISSAILYFRPPSFRTGVGLPLILIIGNLVACRVILDLRSKTLPTESQIEQQNSRIIRLAFDQIRTHPRDDWTIAIFDASLPLPISLPIT
ncbi:hypothetical protein BDQ12DRAFT_681018 [Crucibulum laeve]|uniref:DUF6533 domain-containing protein n=1 Tax=Crucibulum laeve TaxID=68775 RepID=A0A5C3M2S2_9AGAR|nr:hypothetical protein BDQ12DRAFT_681018 [Crucibulum laeve]